MNLPGAADRVCQGVGVKFAILTSKGYQFGAAGKEFGGAAFVGVNVRQRMAIDFSVGWG